MSNVSRGTAIILLIIAALLAAKFICVQASSLPSFDGAMNLDVARSISLGEGYRRNYASREAFPHEIQTGAPYILPSALVFRLAGVGLLQAQIVNILYFLLLLTIVYFLINRSAPRWYAALAVCTVAATPGIEEFGFSGYGEIPSLALFLAATLMYFRDSEQENPRSALIAGALLGAAILTKTVMLIGAGALGLVALMALFNEGLPLDRRRMLRLITFLSGAAVIVISMEVWRVVSLGGIHPWLHWWLREVGHIFEQAGVASAGQQRSHLATKFLFNLRLLARYYGLPIWATSAWLAILTLTLVITFRKPKGKEHLRTLVILIAATVYLGWWLLLTPTSKAWHRRIINGMICADLGLVMAISNHIAQLGVAHLKSFQKLATRVVHILIVLASLVLTYQGMRALFKGGPNSAGASNLMRTADRVKHLPANSYIFGIGWYSAPRVTLFSGRQILDFNDTPIPRIDSNKPVYFIDGPLAPMNVWSNVQNTYGIFRTPQRDFALIGPYHLEPLPLAPSAAPVERYISASMDYPYMRGFNQSEGTNGRWLTSDNLILLSPHEGDRFSLQAYAPAQEAYFFASPPKVIVSFDGCPAPAQMIQPGTATTLYFNIPQACHLTAGQPVNVRIEVDNLLNTAVTTDPRALSLLSHAIGFVGEGE